MYRKLLLAFIVYTFAVYLVNADSFFNECLEWHNKFRAEDGKPPLHESSKVMAHAEERVQALLDSCEWNHDGNAGSGFGENLYERHGSQDKICERAVKKWYKEKENYDTSDPGSSRGTGHYTQVVWKASTELGCAKGTYSEGCSRAGKTVVLCSYFPPGNFGDKFAENV